ncbi:MAG: PEP-CTERM sorting domain-containing protein, partial [Prochlorotrichaceae cyanobacterium]
MRKAYVLFVLTFLVLSKLDAATFQISSNLDNSFGNPPAFSTTVEAPFVGSLTISYDSSSALANGSYALNSLSNFQLSVLFPGVNSGADVTFNETHLDFAIAGIYIQVVDGNFFFTNSASGGGGTSLAGNAWTGAANFINGNYLFTTQPLNNVTRMGFGNYVVEYNALYQLVDISTASTGIAPDQPGYSSGTPIYMGNYGNPTDNLAVPEPSAVSLLAIGIGGWIALR